jgi:L-cysteate sulfo-lyase
VLSADIQTEEPPGSFLHPQEATMTLTRQDLSQRIARLPRVPLRPEPTPLEAADRLSERLGGPRIWLKRDDHPSAALGGNKLRKLELFLGEALARDADTAVTLGAVQSNHVQVTAAACARLGLRCHALLLGVPPETEHGNLFLDRLFGAEIEFLSLSLDKATPDAIEARLSQMVSDLENRGRRPFLIPAGGSSPLGDVSYTRGFLEIERQAEAQGIPLDALVSPVGSMGTFSGLLLAKQLLGSSLRIVGVATSPAETCRRAGLPPLQEMVARAGEFLGLGGVRLDAPPEIHYGYFGPGYGRPSPASREAVRTLAHLEGVLLDPVYTGKVMAGLMDLAARDRFAGCRNVAFLHTGGVNELLVHPEWFQGLRTA